MEFNILSISAEDEQSLPGLASEYIDVLSYSGQPITDICYTSNIARASLENRLLVVGKSKEDLIKKLQSYLKGEEQGEIYTSVGKKKLNGPIAFLFTGQGSHYAGMAREIYQDSPLFKKELDHCDQLFFNETGKSIVQVLYPDIVGGDEINRAIYSQPIIFSIGYALSKLWQSWGVMPSVVMGHSIGEYAAACIAGLFPLEQAVKLVAARAKLMQEIPVNGLMVGVLMNEAKAKSLVEKYPGSASIAAVNSPNSVTLSGDRLPVQHIIEEAKQLRLFVEELNISHPFHSVMMVPYVEKLKQTINGISFSKPTIPIISTISGCPGEKEMAQVDYWSKHICNTVRFYDAVKKASEMGVQCFLEIGGTATLSGLAAESIDDSGAVFLPSLRKGNHPWRQLINTLAHLYSRGIPIQWEKFHSPFNRKEIIFNHQGQENNMGMNDNKKFAAIKRNLKIMIENISGIAPGSMNEDDSLLSHGMDSLMLVQLRKKIIDRYQVDITINDFFTTYSNIEKVTQRILQQSALNKEEEQELPTIQEAIPLPTQSSQLSEPGNNTSLELIISKQLELLKLQNQRTSELLDKQLAMLKKYSPSTPTAPTVDRLLKTGKQEVGEKQSLIERAAKYLPVFKIEKDPLNPQQETFVKDFINAFMAKSQKSKTYSQQYRPVFSDWVGGLNFRVSLKEISYPIVTQKSEGCRLWDLDGNEYIDFAMGYGANYFGHNPQFIRGAIEKQLTNGCAMGPVVSLAGEVADLICRLAHVERVVFSNTGTEAVMAAIRAARTITGRDKIVRFAGSYHGTFDGLLAEADDEGTFPSTLGTPVSMVADTIVLPYGSPGSLKKIESLGNRLACVLVEPIQSRNPLFQPKEFLHHLRELTSRIGSLLIFDDVYMGFRIHQGGSQAYYDINADIVTYGKIVGGGMPIGIVAGKAKYIDSFDGGRWDYEDDSVPQGPLTFYGGTFCRHPLSLAAALAALKYMENEGPQLQERVNQTVTVFADEVNAFLVSENVPLRVVHVGSTFRFEFFGQSNAQSQPFEMELFYYLLRYKGIYLWERRICSLSTAHTGEDMQYLEKAVKETIRELRNGGFAFAGTSQPIPDAAGKIKRYYNLTYAQQRYYVLNQIADLERAVHLTMAMTIKGPLNINKLAAGIQILTNRHDIFRIGFEMVAGEIHLRIHDNVAFQLSHQKASGEQEHIDEWVKKFIHPFDLSTPPLIRIGVVEFPGDSFLLLFDSHHIISDGETANIIIQDLIQLHHGQSLPQVKKNYLDYLDWWDTYSTSPDFKIHEQYWIEKFPTPPPLLQLPLDYLRPNKRNFKGSMVTIPIEKNTAEALKNSVRMSPATLFMLLLASYSVLLYKISGQEDIFIGIPVSLRGENDLDSVAGYLTNNLVFRAHPQMGTPFNTFLNEVKKEWLNAYSHKIYPYELLVEKIEKQKDPGRNPLFDALFIYENVDERILKIDNLDCRLYNFDPDFATYDLSMEVSEAKQSLEIKLYFATQLFKIETIETWAAYFTRILDKILINDAIVIRDILEGLPTLKQTVPPTMLFEQKVDTAILKTNKRLPSNEIEKKLIEIWEEELNREGVGVDDNFFMLGGRSLDTIRTVSRINNRLSTKISLSAIFQYPTVVDLAAFIAGHIMPGNVNIPPAPLKPAYALSQAQIRYWAAAQNLSGSGILEMEGNEITADVLILEGTVQIDLLEKAIAKITERHDILRTVYDEKNGGPVQMIRDNLQIPLEYIDLTTFPITLRKEKLAEHLGKKNKQKFNLKTGPLLTFTLYKMADSLHYLFVNACHISFDGWSVTIIMEELAGFYNAGKAGQTGFSLPPVYRYVDYVEWQERLLKSGQLENQAGYWQEYLAQQIPVAQIPADSQYQIKAAENQDSKIFILKLSKELTQNLHAAASHYNTTLFITLLSILKTWLAIMTNQTTITTGTVFSARTFPGLEKIPGIMMNVLPLRVELSGNPDFQKIIDLTRQAFLQTQNNQDYPLSLVAHKMRKVIDMNRDIYNVIFIGQEPITENIHFDGLKITSCLLGELLAKPNSNDDDFIQCEYTPGIDLLIEMVEENNQIKFILRYNHHKFSTKGIKEYFNHFQFVIEQVITSPTLHLSQLKPFKTVELDDVF